MLTFLQVWFDTDGGRQHFKFRISFYFASTLPAILGNLMCVLLCLAPAGQGIPVHWIFSPSYHGKGECDSHGAVVKRSIRLFVLDGELAWVVLF